MPYRHKCNVIIPETCIRDFRRGALSTLGQSGVTSHTLADFADHASVQTPRVYTTDTIMARSPRAADDGGDANGIVEVGSPGAGGG
eukprot:COSAG06_NODE_6239_length_3022_cov_1.766678_4_plen_86_part_00